MIGVRVLVGALIPRRINKQGYLKIFMKDMNNTIKLLYSLLIGVVATVVAKFVHSSWNLTQLLIFGLIVFAVTFILTLLIKKKRAKK